MTLPVLNSENAIRRALARVGKPDGAGACLANVYQDFGGPAWSSTGPGAGKFGTAIAGWNFAVYRHAGDWNPPPGVPVYFGVDTPRTDGNAKAGDVVLSLGGGMCVATDGPRTGNSEIMTLSARAAQVRRNYLGWTADFLGYPVSGALSYIAEANRPSTPTKPKPIIVKRKVQKEPMILIQNSKSIAMLTGEHVVGLDIDDVHAFQAAGVPTAVISDKAFSKFQSLSK